MTTIFGLYGKEQGLSVYKYFDISSMLAGYLSVTLISYYGQNYKGLIGLFLGLSVVGAMLLKFTVVEGAPKPPKRKISDKEMV